MHKSRGSELKKSSLVAAVALATIVVLSPSARAETRRSVWDGVYTDEQAKQGQALYRENCSSCHGAALIGQDAAPSLAGGDFLSNWSGLTVGDLFERIRTTMPQNKAGSLSREENAAIVAYILSACRFPAGKSALSPQTEVLREIRIDPARQPAKQGEK